MPSIQLNDVEYKNYLRMDKNKHLLVEGRDDTKFFHILFEEFLGVSWQDMHDVVIDNAESLISSDGQPSGNREKIEEICNSFNEHNLVGFVDREFRDFEMLDDLIDQVQGHYYIDRLVWSRGHSIENYYFDLELLRRPFQDVSNENLQGAFRLFSENIESYLRLACLFSLVGVNYGNNIKRIEASLSWNVITLGAALDEISWRRALSRQARFDDNEINHIVGSLPNLIDLITRADIGTVRWLCHGHIGFRFLWCAFARCIYDATEGEVDLKERTAHSFLGSQHSVRFNLCGRALAQAAVNGMADYPSKVFELLEIDINI